MGCLSQVGRAGLGAQVRPELLDDLIARKPVAVGKGEQRDKLLRPTRRPVALEDLPVPEDNPDVPEHLDANVIGTSLHTPHLRAHRRGSAAERDAGACT